MQPQLKQPADFVVQEVLGKYLSTSPKLKLFSVHAAMDNKDEWIARETDHYLNHARRFGQRSADCVACKSLYDNEHVLDKEDSCCLELANALPSLYEVRFKRLYSKRRGEDSQRSIFIARRGSNVELSRIGVSLL